jgi:hypothetical protein
VEINHLDDLKRAIEINSEDIFLIDDAKIIKKDGLHTKFKFLKPKDGIEDSFLYDHGIGDISFDSIDELSRHIITKIDSVSQEEDTEDTDAIQDSIANIVQDAFNENGSADEDTIQLDDELSQLLASNENNDDFAAPPLDEDFFEQEKEEDVPLQTFADIINNQEEKTSDMANDMSEGLQALDIENKEEILQNDESSSKKQENLEDVLDGLDINNNDFIHEQNSELDEFTKVDVQTQNVQDIQGDFNMAEDFSSLDQISENDIIAALNGEEVSLSENKVLTSTDKTDSKEALSLNMDSADDISALLTQLLKNKTLEITVKVKE